MVVLTFLLAKAAYERYNTNINNNNSSASNEDDHTNKNIQRSASLPNFFLPAPSANTSTTTATASNSGQQQQHRRVNNSKRQTNNNNNPLQKSSSRPLSRKPSFQRDIATSKSSSASNHRHTTNNQRSSKRQTTASSSKSSSSSGRANSSKNKSTTETRYNRHNLPKSFSSSSMTSIPNNHSNISGSGVLHNNNSNSNNPNSAPTYNVYQNAKPTLHGNFVIHSKSKLLLLPPEEEEEEVSCSANNNIGKKITMPSNTKSRGAITSTPNGATGNNGNHLVPLLSSAEMTSAMMGELDTLVNQQHHHHSVGGSSSKSAAMEGGAAATKKKQKIDTSNTTFRNDVRNDWVDAVFGTDFFPLDTSSNASAVQHGIVGIKQGVGAANIPHYVTYGAILDANNPTTATSSAPASTSALTTSATPQNEKGLRNSASSKVQSTPLIFSSPSNTSLGGGSLLLGSASLTTSACGELGGDYLANNSGGSSGEGGGGGGFQTPSAMMMTNDGSNRNYAAKYTVEPQTPGTVGSTNASSKTSYRSTTGTIQQQQGQQQQPPKLGITISRIPLGLYVHSISLESEAYTAGISPGSILIDINGMGMLGERSDRALERLWWYTGIFGGSSTNNEVVGDLSIGGNGNTGGEDGLAEGGRNNSSGSAAGSNGGKQQLHHNSSSSTSSFSLQMKKPVVLTLYKHSRIYTVLLLSGNPLSGINWAPCGNFALVHKVAPGSIADECGVRRGTLVVGVNNEGMRTLDHVGVAGLLKETFTRGVRFSFSFCERDMSLFIFITSKLCLLTN